MKQLSFFTRLHTWIVYIFVFLLPTQLGTFFFISPSYIDGIRIDYLAPSIYLTDIFALFLIFPIVSKVLISKNRADSIQRIFTRKILLIGLLLILVNIISSMKPIITLYSFIKISELVLIFLCIRRYSFQPKMLLRTLFLSALLQLILVVSQIMHGGSIQGMWYFFGERSFSLSTPGIAKIVIHGVEILRGYGTFSHPNSLAGFYLLLYGFVSVYSPFQKYTILRRVFLVIATLLILFSFSKVAIVGMLILSAYSNLQKKTTCILCRASQLIVPIVLGLVFLSGVGDPESINKRVWLAQSSLQIIHEHMFVGVGLGNYLIAQSSFQIPYGYFFLQPVHNIFLLIISEIGIPFTLYLIYVLKGSILKYGRTPAGMIAIMIIVYTGMMDHYWLTLQQNMLLIPVIFGLLSNNKSVVK